ncbi:putative unchacterized apicomplexan-specific serine rich low complexity protein [Gregarina niphandrodes]|uniref:Unchacterized apicomplexan-specific serine rich low complexity protein n=1 Tax=Gregarina niphandrodes TaxID=110365 RepID=A0A023BAC8_GRENI|nr:putative unchacterized apicomplexan-specific serine rich low complexity protein [Gregarina niphandrodes]EZG78222.1 putative unchacterized apicomplexan-specific serine rich low complexity protein [Gregarina niphandrodes]|eukprot:XP_011129390.1 putative unchacterized apicomplexan-specific serine rich low complexity protein [Gregarina niphandrodes]
MSRRRPGEDVEALEEDEDEASLVVEENRNSKQELIAKVLSRWWYVLDDWPPKDFDYEKELAERKLKRVGFEQWEAEDDVDEQGRTKVYEITHYPGMFRDAKGNAIDLRPMEGRPCYANLAKRSEAELRQMLKTALAKQIDELENGHSPYNDTDHKYIQRLIKELKKLTN